MKKTILTLILITLAFSITSCSIPMNKQRKAYVSTEFDLMKEFKANAVAGKDVDADFINSTFNFSIELFKRSCEENKNALISPLSVLLALSMTANGADKETLAQMENVLGNGMSINDLNQYLYSYVNSLPSTKKSKLNIANSIWFRDDADRLFVENSFLQRNADFYNAAAYKAKFDDNTLKEINNWVDYHTAGMIDKILDEISDSAVMYLINAIVFDAEWETIYKENDVFDHDFTNYNGNIVKVKMMRSEELKFLKDNNATGFIKPYANGNYSFVALLPNEDISITDYVSSLTGSSFSDIIANAKNEGVLAFAPKFSYDYTFKMNDALIDMGIADGFDAYLADFSRLGKSSNGNLFISEVLHKTFISFDERGTKAGAVTKVEINDEAAFGNEVVNLDRPFVYSIIDNRTNLPVFIGTVLDLG